MKKVPLDLTRQEQAYAEIDDFDQKRVRSPSIIRYESAACHKHKYLDDTNISIMEVSQFVFLPCREIAVIAFDGNLTIANTNDLAECSSISE